jgi:signal transduction histidine kinase
VKLRFRHRIGLLVSLAALALVIIATVSFVLGRQNERELSGIEHRYVPLIELDRDLKTVFAKIPRALEDAASAAEDAKLQEADRFEQELGQRLAAGAATIAQNGGDAPALVDELDAYYKTARQVTAALMAGAPPTELAPRIEAMNRARQAFEAHLEAATSPDHDRLAAAFAAARDAQITSLRIDIAVAAIAFAVMAFLSWRLIRRTVTALRAVSEGVERLAGGEFTQPIDVPPGDELGDLAREANRTAGRLRAAREREHELLVETQRHALATEAANKELEAFSYSVSHDLRAPLRGIDGFSQALLEDYADSLPAKGQDYLRRIRAGAQRMAELIDDMLRLSRVTRAEFRRGRVDLSAIATAVVTELERAHKDRAIDARVQPGMIASADPQLIRITLENLLGNAWKFTAKTEKPVIEVGSRDDKGEQVYFVRDNGAGFDMKYASKLFGAFQRLHTDKEFPGTGIGLATVQRIVHRHGGRIWVDAEVGRGAHFQFTLPEGSSSS